MEEVEEKEPAKQRRPEVRYFNKNTLGATYGIFSHVAFTKNISIRQHFSVVKKVILNSSLEDLYKI